MFRLFLAIFRPNKEPEFKYLNSGKQGDMFRLFLAICRPNKEPEFRYLNSG